MPSNISCTFFFFFSSSHQRLTERVDGGDYFNVTLSASDLFNVPININKTRAVIMRTGFSTHTMNMGQRHVELETSFTTTDDGGGILHVAQLPPNPAILGKSLDFCSY